MLHGRTAAVRNLAVVSHLQDLVNFWLMQVSQRHQHNPVLHILKQRLIPQAASANNQIRALQIAMSQHCTSEKGMRAREVVYQSVERRSSIGASGGFVSDLTGSILALSAGGVSTRAVTSTGPARSGARSDRGRATALASNICDAP